MPGGVVALQAGAPGGPRYPRKVPNHTPPIVPPSCRNLPAVVSYCEGFDAHGNRFIYRQTIEPGQSPRCERSPYPDDEDFVFDPATAAPEHPELAWVDMVVMVMPRRRR